jgi:hypothetical protein
MCIVQNTQATYLMLPMWIQVHVLERGMLQSITYYSNKVLLTIGSYALSSIPFVALYSITFYKYYMFCHFYVFKFHNYFLLVFAA